MPAAETFEVYGRQVETSKFPIQDGRGAQDVLFVPNMLKQLS